MFHVALHEPEIPPNTGNIARLCAATHTRLHLIGALGFRLDDRTLKRAGVDYWPHVDVVRHVTLDDFFTSFKGRLWLVECPCERVYSQANFEDGDGFLFGSESRGLPHQLRAILADRMIGIPLLNDKIRSLNLATTAGIVLGEALRQTGQW
jgi:tRNA (cytidine/uridine-2'-O-)-methyltransferase